MGIRNGAEKGSGTFVCVCFACSATPSLRWTRKLLDPGGGPHENEAPSRSERSRRHLAGLDEHSRKWAARNCSVCDVRQFRLIVVRP